MPMFSALIRKLNTYPDQFWLIVFLMILARCMSLYIQLARTTPVQTDRLPEGKMGFV